MAPKESFTHTKWVYRYHVVFTSKYRKKVIYNSMRIKKLLLKNWLSWTSVKLPTEIATA
jgi:putative transposase